MPATQVSFLSKGRTTSLHLVTRPTDTFTMSPRLAFISKHIDQGEKQKAIWPSSSSTAQGRIRERISIPWCRADIPMPMPLSPLQHNGEGRGGDRGVYFLDLEVCQRCRMRVTRNTSHHQRGASAPSTPPLQAMAKKTPPHCNDESL
jgi:hypothetical protein